MIDDPMIEYAQIEAKAAELARQFWAEIEEGLLRQSGVLSAAAPDTRRGQADPTLPGNLSQALLKS